MSIQSALQTIAAASGSPNELTESDISEIFRRCDRDGDPTTATRAEVDQFLRDQGVSFFIRPAILNALFSNETAGSDRRLSPSEALDAAFSRADGSGRVAGVQLRRRR